MEAQEIFDTVAKHLAQQGHRAFANGRCQYRAADGEKCAVGILVLDEEYTPRWEAAGELWFVKREGLLPDRFIDHYDLLVALQEVHDKTQVRVDKNLEPDPRAMRIRFEAVAAQHELSPAILDALTFPDVWV